MSSTSNRGSGPSRWAIARPDAVHAPRPRASLRSSGARARVGHRREVDERRTAERRRRGQGERRLAGAAGPGERHEPRVVAADESPPPAPGPLDGSGSGTSRRRLVHARQREGRIVLEDPALEGAEIRRRLEPESSRAARRGRRRGVAATGAAQGEDQRLAAARDVDARRRAPRFAYEGGAALPQIQVDPPFEGGEPRFVEPRRSASANGAYATSASAGPRQSASALGAPPDRPARGARTARRRARRTRSGRGTQVPS